MIVECVKIYNEFKKEFVESSPWLTIGKKYIVLEILCCIDNGISYRLISDDEDGSPGIFSANQFQIITFNKPTNWEIDISTNGTFIIGPKAWFRAGFWEDCYDGDIKALEIYKREARIILQEGGVL